MICIGGKESKLRKKKSQKAHQLGEKLSNINICLSKHSESGVLVS